MHSVALIGLGSNLGDRLANLNGAIAALGQVPVSRSAGQLVSRNRAGRRATGPGDVPERSRRARDRPRTAAVAQRSSGDRDPIRARTDRSIGASGRWISICCFSTTGSSTRPSCACRIRECAPGDLCSSRWSKWPPAAVDPVTGRPFAAILADLIRKLGLIKSVDHGPLSPGKRPLSFVHGQHGRDAGRHDLPSRFLD